jgi:5'-3' exonuclease
MLLDSASLYFRAFFGVPSSVTAPDGAPVNAVRGFLDMVATLVTVHPPTRLVACWDDDWRPDFRVRALPSYKAHRLVPGTDHAEDAPAELNAQVPVIADVLAALGVPRVGHAGFEADDVMGTLAERAAAAGTAVDVVTGDRDLFQVIDDSRQVRVIYTARGMSNLEIVTDAVLRGKYGVTAAQYADFAAMRGDSSDGLPGVPGIGEKTAASLLAQFGNLDGVIAAAGDAQVPLSAGIRMKIKAAADYLTRAPAVVEVVRDLDLPAVEARIGIPDPGRNEIARLQTRWGLGGSVPRVVAALDTDRSGTGRSR